MTGKVGLSFGEMKLSNVAKKCDECQLRLTVAIVRIRSATNLSMAATENEVVGWTKESARVCPPPPLLPHNESNAGPL